MTYEEAKEILRKNIDEETKDLNGDMNYVYWHRGQEIDLDGRFTVQELEAIVVYTKGTTRP